MTPDQQRKMLEAAAKACGLTYLISGEVCDPEHGNYYWNPITNPADCAEMCAKLEINQFHWPDAVACDTQRPPKIGAEASLKDHGNSRLKAWMFAATMVAAKVGGYTE